MGIKLLSYPNSSQKIILSQWMGCARIIWNAKCEEDHYLRTFARKFLPIGTYPSIDQSYSQYKTELTPWLKECPSQILRNSASNWYATYQDFFKGLCGRPRRKNKGKNDSIWLTKDVFKLDQDEFGNWRLFIGAKKNNIGYLKVKFHDKNFSNPNSIRIRKEKGNFYVSFTYNDSLDESRLWENEQFLEHYSQFTAEELNQITVGIDRGVIRPVQAGDNVYDLTNTEKVQAKKTEISLKKIQKRLSKKQKGSKHREECKKKLGKKHQKLKNIRENFCHQTSRKLVNGPEKIFIIEDLKLKNMTKSAKGTEEKPGKNVRAKSGLNRGLLSKGLGRVGVLLEYKSYRAGKVVFKINPSYSSQECADCGHTHPDNRATQNSFICTACGHTDNADRNASFVLKKRAINMILYSGTELSKRGVLTNPFLVTGRGGHIRPMSKKCEVGKFDEALKKKRPKATKVLEARVL